MHNTLIAAGPDFQHGQNDNLPTGNIDLAPTILQILDIQSPQHLDGRILSETMVSASSRSGGLQSTDQMRSERPETKTIEVQKDFASGVWRQSLKISRVGSTIYLDEGNGAFERKNQSPFTTR
jgi:arylsulfatase A-like enzyme